MIFTPVGETPEYVVLRMEQAIFMCLFAAEHTHTHTHTQILLKNTQILHTQPYPQILLIHTDTEAVLPFWPCFNVNSWSCFYVARTGGQGVKEGMAKRGESPAKGGLKGEESG